MKKNIKVPKENYEEYVSIFIEIDTEKHVVCITNRTDNNASGVAKRFKNKKDIVKIINKYVYRDLNLYSSNYKANDEKRRTNKRKKSETR